MRKTFLVLAAVVALLSTGLAEAAGTRERHVTISRGRVAPHALRVESGTKVTWRNMDAVAQAVVVHEHVGSDGKKSDPAIKSSPLAKYERGAAKTVASFSHTFVNAGTYRYKLAGTSSTYTITVDAAKVKPIDTRTPTATPTPRPAKPTATPTPVPSATPKPGSASSALATCSGWAAQKTGTLLTLTGECELANPGFAVQLRPRVLKGDVLLVDRVVTRRGGASAEVITTVPLELTVNAGAYKEVVVMPDAVRVPVVGATQPGASG